MAAKACAESGKYAGVACLGAVIRGETDHYDYVCQGAAYGIQRVQLDTGVPCTFGVLTVDNMDQALARSGGGERDTGYNAAATVVQMARLVRRAEDGLGPVEAIRERPGQSSRRRRHRRPHRRR